MAVQASASKPPLPSADGPAPGAGKHYGRGVAMVLLAGVCLSSGGLLVRSVEAADGWQILFYRAVAFTVTSFCFTLWLHRGRWPAAYRAIGIPGLIGAGALGVGFAAYLFALLHTTVANLAFILSAGPFFAALLGWLLLKERVAAFTWLTMTLALAGIGLMLLDGLGAGHMTGNLIALLAPITFAVMLIAIRFRADRDMTPILPLAGLVAALLALPMLESIHLSPRDLVLSLMLGSVQIGAGFILITLGARWVPAAQVALLSLTETVLAPTWVWLIFDERPSAIALIGGLIVLGAVAAEGLRGLRRAKGRR
jgi:drug/metabolite transporter (DMT)-like permease